MTATQSVELPGPLVWDLWKLAEAHNVTVAELIRTAITPTKPVKPTKTQETHARIIAYVEAGLEDGEIAMRIDRTRGYVADVRRRNNMKPNKRKAT